MKKYLVFIKSTYFKIGKEAIFAKFPKNLSNNINSSFAGIFNINKNKI